MRGDTSIALLSLAALSCYGARIARADAPYRLGDGDGIPSDEPTSVFNTTTAYNSSTALTESTSTPSLTVSSSTSTLPKSATTSKSLSFVVGGGGRLFVSEGGPQAPPESTSPPPVPASTPKSTPESTSESTPEPTPTSTEELRTAPSIQTSASWSNGTGLWGNTTLSTVVSSSSTTDPVETQSFCYDNSRGVTTVISLIYTATTTWHGNGSDYTASWPSITLPTPCDISQTIWIQQAGSDDACIDQNRDGQCDPPVTYIPVASARVGWQPSVAITTTFFTTARNPSVIFSPIITPTYGVLKTSTFEHTTATSGPGTVPIPDYGDGGGSRGPQQQQSPSVVIVVRSHTVIIGGSTIVDDGYTGSKVVTVGGQRYTVNPSEVIGGGATITRPQYVDNRPPTITNLGGLDVTVTKDKAIVAGRTFDAAVPTTAVVEGQTVVIGGQGIAVGGATLALQGPATQVMIAGGELITAMGQSVVVIDGKTLTYGPGIPPVTTTIEGDVITVGPSGVVVHGSTVGGPGASPGETRLLIVGGASITEIGRSVVVIDGKTFTVGPNGPSGKTVLTVGGELITVGPEGVIMSTMVFPYPFGEMTTTAEPGSAVGTQAAQTSKKKNAATWTRGEPPRIWLWLALGFLGFFVA